MLKYLSVLFTLIWVSVYPQIEINNGTPHEEEEYLAYEGKIVRKILIRIIEVAGPAVDEENGKDSSWFGEITNSLHFSTKDWVVKNYLLFREGDSLDALSVSESERLLRESGFFTDARIQVWTVAGSDSIDVRVAAKDKWTLIPQLSFNAEENSYVGFTDENFLGWGHKLDGTISHDNDPTVGWGGKILYTAHNVAGYFTDITGGLQTNKKSTVKLLELSRPFISLKTQYAGGLGINWNDGKLLYVNSDSTSLIPFSRFSYELWGGYSIPAMFGPSVFRKRTNIIFSAGISGSDFSNRPVVSSDSNRVFTNNFMYLLTTGIINRRFYRDHYLQRFGPSEDVPVGGMFAITGGYDINEFNKRLYSGVEGVFSRRIPSFGYLSLYAAAGGFYFKETWQQNVYTIDLLYHSKLYMKGNWKWRFLARNNFLIGDNRFEQEQVFLDNDNGFRGYDRFILHGVSRGLLKLEGRLFSPFSPLGFSLGANFFTDIGIIADQGEHLFNSRIYKSFGAGLKIANESISEAQFDVALVYIPFTPMKKTGSFTVLFSSSLILGTRNFNFSKPSVIKYGEN
jgi:hypothetical protein